MKTILLGGAALIACLAMLASSSTIANASPLPPATSDAGATNAFPLTQSSGASSASVEDASASVVTYPYVSLQAQVSDGRGQSATADLTYYFSVVGGIPGTSVLVDVATNLLTIASAEPAPGSTAFYGFAAIYVGPTAGLSVCTDSTQCSSSQFSGIIPLYVNSGDQVQVHFEIEALGNPFFSGNAFASADPFIYVDSTNLNAADYCIQVSAGVGNRGSCGAGATPLPAALPLFASGLGALGLLGWRRKRKNAAAVSACVSACNFDPLSGVIGVQN